MDDDVDASESGENRGGRGKCILDTCIRMKREESKSCHPRLLVPDESEFQRIGCES